MGRFGRPKQIGFVEKTMSDEKKTLWAHRGEDGVSREKQLLIDILCATVGGPMYYRGKDVALAPRGMRTRESDGNASSAMPPRPWRSSRCEAVQRDVVALVPSLKKDIVE
jgi:hemoglobin